MRLDLVPWNVRAIDPQVIFWPLLFGLGATLLLTAQAIGRPKPDLGERLRRLDVDERIRAQLSGVGQSPVFAFQLLERMLGPVLDDLGRLAQAVLARIGLGPGADLARKLHVARPGVEPAQFFGEKVACALIGAAFFPLMNAVGIHPFGPWPIWGAAAGLVGGFVASDWQLEERLAKRRTRSLMELPTILDML